MASNTKDTKRSKTAASGSNDIQSGKKTDAANYFARTKVMTYIEDAIAQLLTEKDAAIRINPNKFFLTYFASVKKGSHVLLREFSFVSATLHNRQCFVRNYWKSFINIGRKGELLPVQEYHSLALLLCSDFPFPLIQKSCSIATLGGSADCHLSFSDFLYSFNLQFSFDDYIAQCQKMYSSIEGHNPDGKVNSGQFLKKIKSLYKDPNIDCPPIDLIKEILSKDETVSFYEFLKFLSMHSGFIKITNNLPSRTELYKEDNKDLDLHQTDDSWD